jgi:hypothetical protein
MKAARLHPELANLPPHIEKLKDKFTVIAPTYRASAIPISRKTALT